MSLQGNGNVMRLVADVYLSAGKKKSFKRRQAGKYFISWSAKRFGQSCNPSSLCQSELVKDLSEKLPFSSCCVQPWQGKDAFIVLRCSVHICIQPTNIYWGPTTCPGCASPCSSWQTYGYRRSAWDRPQKGSLGWLWLDFVLGLHTMVASLGKEEDAKMNGVAPNI